MKIKLSNKQKHILLWLWLADHPNAYKDDFFTEHPDFGHPMNDCFACQAAGMTDYTPAKYCNIKCPMRWIPKKFRVFNYCCEPESYYMLWVNANSEEARIKYARKIVISAIKSWVPYKALLGINDVDIALSNREKFILEWSHLADYPDLSREAIFNCLSPGQSVRNKCYAFEEAYARRTFQLNTYDFCQDCPITWTTDPTDSNTCMFAQHSPYTYWQYSQKRNRSKYAKKMAIMGVKHWTKPKGGSKK